jgi:hypothetical protein
MARRGKLATARRSKVTMGKQARRRLRSFQRHGIQSSSRIACRVQVMYRYGAGGPQSPEKALRRRVAFMTYGSSSAVRQEWQIDPSGTYHRVWAPEEGHRALSAGPAQSRRYEAKSAGRRRAVHFGRTEMTLLRLRAKSGEPKAA